MRRTLLCLVISFGMGAWAFSGQGDEEDELRSRIRALTAELARRADTEESAKSESTLVWHAHEYRTPTWRAGTVWSSTELDLAQSKLQPPAEVDDSERNSGFDFDETIHLIRTVVEPESWEKLDGVDLRNANGGMFIHHLPRAHSKIAALLHGIRKIHEREVRVEIVAVPVGDRDLALSESEMTRLAATERLGSLRFRCPSGRLVRRRVGRSIHYAADYRVEVAEGATIGDLEGERVFDGCSVTARALLDDSANGVRLELRLDRNRVPQPFRRADTEHGPIELPAIEVTRLRTGFWVPLGRWTVAGGSSTCLFLVRVDRLPPP